MDYKRGEPIGTLGNTQFSLYPIMMFIGILSAFLTVCYFGKRQKYPGEILQILLIIVIPSAILGARTGYVLFEPKVGANMSFANFFHFQGMAIQGGVIFAVATGLPYLYSRRHVIDIRIAVGIIVPAIFIGQTIGRIGNFTNHEVYGPEVSGDSLNGLSGIGIKQHMHIEGAYRAPFFLYEMFGTFTAYILVVGVLLYRNLVRPGVTAGLYALIYGLIRVIMEPLRDPSDIMKTGNVQISTIISIFAIIFGLFLIGGGQFLTKPFYPFVIKIIPQKMTSKFTKEYQLITPVKPRRQYIGFGKKQDTRKRFTFFGHNINNYVRIGIPKINQIKLSKKQLNAGVLS